MIAFTSRKSRRPYSPHSRPLPERLNPPNGRLISPCAPLIVTLPARILRQLPVGNAYVNRSQVGAVIGVQPFGGRGLSGTGPKAGGPLTLHAFAEERSVSVNSAAFGGDAALLAAGEA